MKILLNSNEIELSRFIAHRRRQAAIDGGYYRPLKSDENDLQVNINAYGAELAFCQMVNAYPDFSMDVNERKGDVMYKGVEIDVKCGSGHNGYYYVTYGKSKDPCDVYVFMTGEMPVYYYVGYIRASSLFVKNNEYETRKGLCYRVHDSKLDYSISVIC